MYAKKSYPLLTALIVVLCLILLGVGWYLFDTNVDRSGWVEKDGVYSYRDFHWKKVTGWQDIDGKRYYFGEDKIMVTHWLEKDGNRYYLGRDGALDLGWLTIDGKRYYSDETGAIQTGWQTVDFQHYYLGEDGVLHTGWLEMDGNSYYFAEDGVMASGLVTLENGTYYFGTDGVMVTGPAAIEEQHYFFGEDGTMHTGWLEQGDAKYYYLPKSGILATGWQDIDGKRYCFDGDGAMHTGWLEDGEYTYYLLPDGTAATGKQEINGAIHYFTPKGIHVVLVNASHKVPSYYTMNLVKIDGWFQVSDVCYDALRKMLDDCKEAVGYYEFNSGYRSINDQQAILEQRTQENMVDGREYAAARAIALRSVALPGTSEHHLGLAVDILGDAAQEWLQEHCWEYGFIVRYPESKSAITGIIYEPWHFRYVGTEVSLDMKDSGLCLEEYLGAHPIEVPEETEEAEEPAEEVQEESSEETAEEPTEETSEETD